MSDSSYWVRNGLRKSTLIDVCWKHIKASTCKRPEYESVWTLKSKTSSETSYSAFVEHLLSLKRCCDDPSLKILSCLITIKHVSCCVRTDMLWSCDRLPAVCSQVWAATAAKCVHCICHHSNYYFGHFYLYLYEVNVFSYSWRWIILSCWMCLFRLCRFKESEAEGSVSTERGGGEASTVTCQWREAGKCVAAKLPAAWVHTQKTELMFWFEKHGHTLQNSSTEHTCVHVIH